MPPRLKVNREQLTRFEYARQLLEYSLRGSDDLHYDRDCWCGQDGCSIENPVCQEMHGVAALKALDEAMEPRHESYHPSRLAFTAERIFADLWKRENKREPHINYGRTLLENILTPPDAKRVPIVSDRDARVAASVIQWLGTSIGRCFIGEAQREIEKARVVENTIGGRMLWNKPEDPTDLETAEVLLDELGADKRKPNLVRRVAAALTHAKKTAITNALKAAATTP